MFMKFKHIFIINILFLLTLYKCIPIGLQLHNEYKAIQLFPVDERDEKNPKLLINLEELDNIFLHNHNVKLKPLKVLVICGEPRIGKSTFSSLLYNNNNAIELDNKGNVYIFLDIIFIAYYL